MWGFILALAAGAVALQLKVIEPLHAGGRTSVAGVAILVAAFVFAELCVVHATVGRDAHSFAFAEIPFVLEGLVEAQWLKEWTPASA